VSDLIEQAIAGHRRARSAPLAAYRMGRHICMSMRGAPSPPSQFRPPASGPGSRPT
jgi:hypothetical protein